MNSFFKNLINYKDKLSAGNDKIWMLMVKCAIIHRDGSSRFKFHKGKEIKVEAE